MSNNKNINRSNKNILVATCIFLAVFVGMIGYLVYFQLVEAGNIINNPYNKRQEVLAKKVLRGQILASDGSVLATSVIDTDGNEIRYYPYGRLMCHTLGYVGNGGSGLENSAAYYMLTSNENIWDIISNDLSGQKHKGDSVVTTLDVELSNAAYDALAGNYGSVIIIEPDSGKILTMVSTPDFDPNTIDEDWDIVSKDEETAALLNRATQGLYPPGSVFKMVTLLQYYRENTLEYEEYQYYCDGSYEIGDTKISCSHNVAHGMQNITEAFANSCNGAFIDMGLSLNISGYQNTARKLLFNQKLPLNMEFSVSQFLLDDESTEWEIAQTAFGQGETLVTPMHLALICSAIANDGVLMQPYLIDSIVNTEGRNIQSFSGEEYGELISKEEAVFLQNNMTTVVEKSFSWLFNDDSYQVAGKSGTAQYGSLGYEHSLFVSYSPVEYPEIVVVVVLEGGADKSKTAAEVSKEIYDFYYKR